MVRDPSSLIVGFVLPFMLLLLFGFGISFDATRIKIGLVIEDPKPETNWFFVSLANSPFFSVQQANDRRVFLDDLAAGRLNGVIVLAGDFAQRLSRGDTAKVQVITDGSDPNTAGLVRGYVQGAWPNFNSIAVSSPTSRAQHIDFTRLYFWAPNYFNLCDAKIICVHVLYD